MKNSLAIIALAAIGVLLVNYYVEDDGSQLFLSQALRAEEVAFMNWVSQYGKSYRTKEEYHFRFEQFKKTLKEIVEHDESFHGSTVGLHEYSANTKEEWKRMLGRKSRPHKDENKTHTQESDEEPLSGDGIQIEKSIDWRQKGGVTEVKNQGECGSCWAFASIGAIEGAYFVKFDELISLSEQQLIDCVRPRDGITDGCEGGLETEAWQFLIDKNKGVVQEETYSYTGMDDARCPTFKQSEQVAFVSRYQEIAEDESSLKVALNYRPVAVGIEGESDFFRNYRSGVITRGCGNAVDHAVLAVGYGKTIFGTEYFIVKNSWGPTWGEKGYARIAPDQCGITIGGPARVYVH